MKARGNKKGNKGVGNGEWGMGMGKHTLSPLPTPHSPLPSFPYCLFCFHLYHHLPTLEIYSSILSASTILPSPGRLKYSATRASKSTIRQQGSCLWKSVPALMSVRSSNFCTRRRCVWPLTMKSYSSE